LHVAIALAGEAAGAAPRSAIAVAAGVEVERAAVVAGLKSESVRANGSVIPPFLGFLFAGGRRQATEDGGKNGAGRVAANPVIFRRVEDDALRL
jgi:hypothetical protein